MARGRRKIEVVAARGGNNVKAAIIAQGGGLALLGTAKERNIVVRVAMETGGTWYMRRRYHLRFTSMTHARRLGYRRNKVRRRTVFTTSAGGHTIRDTDPLVDTGELARAALERFTVKGRSTKAGKHSGKARVTIRFRRPHPMRPEDAAVLRAITGDEIQAIAQVVGADIAATLDTAKPITSGRGKRSGKRTLTGATSRLTGTVSRAA